ncbi:MAG TPA: GNAT family N-acetyltransferase [Kofleriaceae bacterium]|nr:GNAT family N-acetyltransferase [Kofleriaceae bacterium]
MIAAPELPDEPRWIEAHAMAADPASWRRALGEGFAVGNDRARLVVVAGNAEAGAVTALAEELPRHALLIAIERADLAAATRRGVARGMLHTLPEAAASALPEVEGAVALPAEVALTHVTGPLGEELAGARGHRTIWAAFVDGQPVSFAYAPWRSARWFDVSVETLPGARQLGLGRMVAAAMIRDERAQGREPVWGADEGNLASLALARSLGFVKVDELWVAV